MTQMESHKHYREQISKILGASNLVAWTDSYNESCLYTSVSTLTYRCVLLEDFHKFMVTIQKGLLKVNITIDDPISKSVQEGILTVPKTTMTNGIEILKSDIIVEYYV